MVISCCYLTGTTGIITQQLPRAESSQTLGLDVLYTLFATGANRHFCVAAVNGLVVSLMLHNIPNYTHCHCGVEEEPQETFFTDLQIGPPGTHLTFASRVSSDGSKNRTCRNCLFREKIYLETAPILRKLSKSEVLPPHHHSHILSLDLLWLSDTCLSTEEEQACRWRYGCAST